MISADLARALRDAGLVWRPRWGDRFQLDEPDLDAQVFTVSETAIEPRDHPAGTALIFTGTTDWAVGTVEQYDALWLPSEEQLRELLRGTFRGLVRLPDTFRVDVEIGGAVVSFEHPEPSDAYALALCELLRRVSQ